jgi:plasmid replication initiation protein
MSHIMVSKIPQDKLTVTQANKLVKASYTMTLEEKRIVLLMMSLVRKDDKDFHTYRIPITEVRDFLGLENDKDLYGRLKNVAQTLRSRTFLIEKESGGFLAIGWVSSAEYKPKGEDGLDAACLELCFDPKLKPYLLALIDQFSTYSLRNVVSLGGFNHIRIYELLNSYRKIGVFRSSLDELKKILNLKGKYALYADFRRYVLMASQRELEDKTDLAFDFEDNASRGRKVSEIVFRIRNNVPKSPDKTLIAMPEVKPEKGAGENGQQPQLLPPTEAEKETARLYREAITEGVNSGVRESAMKELLETRDPRHVMENIELARERHINSKREGADLAALTVAAITSDYAADARERRQKAQDKTRTREDGKKARELLETIETAATVARRHDLTTRLDAMPKGERDALRAAFGEKVAGGKCGDHMAAGFRARGWKAAGMEASFRIYAAERLGIGSEEEYQRAEAVRRGHSLEKLKGDAKNV